jgi:tyrosine-protein phosphatase YwqE
MKNSQTYYNTLDHYIKFASRIITNNIVNVVSSDILSRNEKNATMQDQSQERTRRVFRLVRVIRRVKTIRPVLLYYEM